MAAWSRDRAPGEGGPFLLPPNRAARTGPLGAFPQARRAGVAVETQKKRELRLGSVCWGARTFCPRLVSAVSSALLTCALPPRSLHEQRADRPRPAAWRRTSWITRRRTSTVRARARAPLHRLLLHAGAIPKGRARATPAHARLHRHRSMAAASPSVRLVGFSHLRGVRWPHLRTSPSAPAALNRRARVHGAEEADHPGPHSQEADTGAAGAGVHWQRPSEAARAPRRTCVRPSPGSL
jgi:hypothetical protein